MASTDVTQETRETSEIRSSWLKRALDSDIWYSFCRSPITIVSAIMTLLFFFAAIFAPLVAPHNPFDLASIDIMDASLPPVWQTDGDPRFPLGTDDQGRDVYSTIIFGARISLFVGFASVIFSLVMGVGLGLVSGYVGGRLDAFIMRVADIQLSFPAILIALLIDGVARSVLPRGMHEELAFYVLIFAIGISGWVQYARTVRGSTLVEKNKEYVQAARVIGIGPAVILLRHV
ncbi:MAG: ABC transporter permease, partial [Pseudomonadota bacterium]